MYLPEVIPSSMAAGQDTRECDRFRWIRGRKWLVASILLASCLMRAGGSAAVAEDATGTVRGTVRYVTDPSRPWRLGRYYIRRAQTGELAEAVVALQSRGLRDPNGHRDPVTVTVDQKNFQFVPETSVIHVGDQVRFLNSGDHAHNVKTSHARHSFNVTMPVDGEHYERFNVATGTRDPFVIDCVFHASMKAWIFVFEHPWFALTGENGVFELTDVPPGEYRLEVVHPAGGLRSSETIQVAAGQTTEVSIPLRPSQPIQ